jgi:hypothetical protein
MRTWMSERELMRGAVLSDHPCHRFLGPRRERSRRGKTKDKTKKGTLLIR